MTVNVCKCLNICRSTHRCWRVNLYLLTVSEILCLSPRLDNTMCSASLPLKRIDWLSSSKYDNIWHEHFIHIIQAFSNVLIDWLVQLPIRRLETQRKSRVVVCPLQRNQGPTEVCITPLFATSTSPSQHTQRYV